MKKIILILTSASLAACSANVTDAFSKGISDITRPDNPYAGGSEAGPGGTGTGGNCYPDPSIGRTCTSNGGDMFGDPNDQGIITVELLNLNGGEFLRGGGEFFIKYRTKITYEKFKSVYSKIELKRASEPASAPWTLVADKIVSNDNELVSYKWNICPHPSSQCPENSSGEPILLNGNDYKVRITSNRLADQSGETTSTGQFTIDSAAPVLESYVSGTLGFTENSSPIKGFVKLDIKGAYDSLSNISKVCIKPTDYAPAIMDTCWMPVTTFNAIHTVGVNRELTLEPIPLFLGYTQKLNVNYYLWLMDSAGNITSLSQIEEEPLLGIDKKDRITVSQTVTSYTDSVHKPGAPADALSLPTTGFNFKTDATGSLATVFDDSVSNLLGNVGDPNSFVVTSSGVAYVKQSGPESPKGIYKINLMTGKGSLFIPQGNHNDPDNKVNDPLKIALDHNEDLWVMDYTEEGKVIISKIKGLSSNFPVMEDIIGGGANESSAEMAATALRIPYSDNLRWYGAFSPLPDGSLVFSSTDPTKAIKPISGTGLEYRIYTPSRPTAYQIRSFGLKSTDSFGVELLSLTGNFVKDFRPYGRPAFSWDWSKGEIGKMFFRFCVSDVTTCRELLYAEFDGQGNFVRYLPSFLPWHLGNEALTLFNDKLYSMNAIQGTMANLTLSGVGSQWSSVFSTEGSATGYCNNGAPAGECRVRIKDYFINGQGKVFFIDEDRIRFVDDDGAVQSAVSVM